MGEFPLHNIGPLVEGHPMFPRRVNFEIVNQVDAGHLTARVWERGFGGNDGLRHGGLRHSGGVAVAGAD